jgi:hypothetical protein
MAATGTAGFLCCCLFLREPGSKVVEASKSDRTDLAIAEAAAA